MAKGRDKHQAYLNALNLLGKDLARRAKSKCELLEISDELRPYDLSAGEEEPSLDHVVLICAKAREALKAAESIYLEYFEPEHIRLQLVEQLRAEADAAP